ncbi:efflux RND transporter periplasmic adaptor subunit [bacterium]|nr:efflux RND transporter periplasmic adaptor subunit [bacterium]
MSVWNKLSGWKLPILGAFALGFALSSVLSRKPNPPRQPMVVPPVADFPQSIAGIGIIEPASELIAVATEIPGVVRQVHVKVGDHVRAGTPLFSLDQRDIKAQLAALQAELRVSQVQVDQTNDQFNRIKSLKDSPSISKDEYTRREYAAAMAQAQFTQIKAKIAQAETTRDRLVVRAPISGKVLAVNVRPGEMATTQASEPLVRMGDTSRLHVRVELDEQNANRVKPGADAFGSPRGDATRKIPLRFVRFEPYVKPKVNLATGGQRVDTRVLQVVYALADSSDAFYVGQQLDVFINGATTTQNVR